MNKPIRIQYVYLMCIVLIGIFFAQETTPVQMPLKEFYIERYAPDLWPKSDKPLIPGLNLDNYNFRDFKLREKRYFSLGNGTNYALYHKNAQLTVWVIIQVRESVEAAQQAMFEWLQTGTTALLRKGTLSDPGSRIGDVSYADPNFTTLVFARQNVYVMLWAKSKTNTHRSVVDDLARRIDDEMIKDMHLEIDRESIQKMRPVIEIFELEKPRLKIGESSRLVVIAHDPFGEELHYQYHTTGGSITTRDDKVYYLALETGTHKITIMVVSTENHTLEKTISVTVSE